MPIPARHDASRAVILRALPNFWSKNLESFTFTEQVRRMPGGVLRTWQFLEQIETLRPSMTASKQACTPESASPFRHLTYHATMHDPS
jgi:hypothetical protein